MTDRWHQKQNKYQARIDRNLIVIRKCKPHFEYWGFQPREILAKQKSFRKSLVCIFLFPFSCACVYVCFWGWHTHVHRHVEAQGWSLFPFIYWGRISQSNPVLTEVPHLARQLALRSPHSCLLGLESQTATRATWCVYGFWRCELWPQACEASPLTTETSSQLSGSFE